MTMKKKLSVTTLAASIMFASIAGLPLSEKGLANKLGITPGVASATVVTTATALEKLNDLRDELARDTQGFADAKATRDYVKNHTDGITSVKKKELLGNVWTKIQAKSTIAIDLEPVFTLFNGLDLFYDESGNAIDALISNPVNRKVIDDLFQGVGLKGIDDANGLSKQSVIDFQVAALSALQEQSSKDLLLGSIASAFLPGGSSQSIKNAINSIVTTKVLSQNILISNFLNAYGITLGDLNAVQNNIANSIMIENAVAGEQVKSARTAIESAGVRYLLHNEIVYSAVNTTSTSVEPGLTVFGQSVNSFLTWSLQSKSGVKFEAGKLVLDGVNSGSGIIQARDSKFGLLLYISPTLSLNQTVNPGGGGGGGTTVTPPIEDPAKIIDDIKKLATLDLNSLVKVENGTAKPTLNETEIANQIKEIAAKSKELNEQLKKLDPNAPTVKLQLNLDFGTIDAKTIEIPLGKALLAAAVENGFDTVAISMNGLTLGVSPTEFVADTTLKVTSLDTTVATGVTQLPVAAGVYEFEFTSGGSQVSSFNTPVQVTIPVPNGNKFDTELLSLAKIVDGKLEFYGGSYANGVLNAVRNGFSTYTVVENKVTFNDTTSVKAWAGRQIQVAAAKGILEGRAEQAFEPNGLVTRAEFAKMIVKTFSLESDSATENFTDVNDSDWYKVYVASAVKNGIVNGKEAGKFDPNGQITRAEMAVMSSRALALKGVSLSPSKVDEALKGFTDAAAINASLKDGVALAASEGIVVGEEGNVFNPNANSTRAQAAVVIYRLLNK